MSVAGFVRPHPGPLVNNVVGLGSSTTGALRQPLPRCAIPKVLPSQARLWSATKIRAVIDPTAISILDACPTSTPLLISSIQEFRDFFRGFLLPGFAILTFTLPTVVLGLLWRSFRDNFKSPRGEQMLSVTLPPPELNSQTASLAAKLIVSILIDLVGDGSFIIPGAGEGFDFLWAPVSALLIRQLYGSNVLGLVAFVEELLPFTDIIPTATLAFVLEVFFAEVDKANTRGEDGKVIDVRATAMREEQSRKEGDR